VHTAKDVWSLTVFYDEKVYFETHNITRYSKAAVTYDIKGIEAKGERNVHTALLTNLTPNTIYAVRVYYNGKFWATRYYKTLTDRFDDQTNITMVNAGDSGTTEPVKHFMPIIGSKKPDIFNLGGDIAYDDNMPAC